MPSHPTVDSTDANALDSTDMRREVSSRRRSPKTFHCSHTVQFVVAVDGSGIVFMLMKVESKLAKMSGFVNNCSKLDFCEDCLDDGVTSV